MEDDKIAFLEDVSSRLEKQRKIINGLEKERNNIAEDINVVTCKKQSRNDETVCQKIFQLLEDFGKCKSVIRRDKDDLKELEVQIKKVN